MGSSSASTEGISGNVMIPDLLMRHPSARQVLDQYGLKGCGGALGPHESLSFFARAHDVNEDVLINEIERAIECSPPTPQAASTAVTTPETADTIYRRFFFAAIIVALTSGATWGATILWRIATGGYASVSPLEINAHGQAQVFGWMGLFILGFGYQAFPRFWHTTLAYPRLAVTSFIAMAVGITAAAIGLGLGRESSYAMPLAFWGSALELCSITIFSVQMGITLKRSGKPVEPYIAAIFTACTWFVISSAYNLWHVWNILGAASNSQMASIISTYQPVLRDMQFLGAGMTMVVGVSLRTLPHLYVLKKIAPSRAWTVLGLLTVGVIVQVALALAQTDPASFVRMLPPGIWLTGVALLLSDWKLWRPFPEHDRSTKFIQAAYAWLIVSLLIFAGLPVYMTVLHPHSAHAYIAASHHAITVGFISIMIMGHAAKVVPTLNGVRQDKLTSLLGPFLLINIGCALRVVTQILTDWTPTAFRVIGISGTLEVIALAWWGGHLISVMVAGKRQEKLGHEAPSILGRQLTGDEHVATIIKTYPQLIPVFMKYGFTAVVSPAMLNTVARTVPLKLACRMHDVPLDAFLQDANSLIDTTAAQGTSGKPPLE